MARMKLAAAIAFAVRGASAEDVVLVAGRGHETEQLFASGPRPFSDAAFLRALRRPGGEGTETR